MFTLKNNIAQDEQLKQASITSYQLKEQYIHQQKVQEQQMSYQHAVMMEEELRIFRRDQLLKQQSQQKEILFEVSQFTLNIFF